MPAPIVDLKARAQEIKKTALLAELQKLLSRLESPELTREQLDRLQLEVADCQKRYRDLGFGA